MTNTTLKNLKFKLRGCELQIHNSSFCSIIDSSFEKPSIHNSHNITFSNSLGGAILYNSHNCTIQNSSTSVFLVGSNHNKIIHTQIKGDFLVFYFENSNSNLFFGNNIDCTAHKLISMIGNSDNNLFVANNFSNYAHFEPTFSHTGTNMFYHNNFFNSNWLQSDPDFTVSTWDDGLRGNFWCLRTNFFTLTFISFLQKNKDENKQNRQTTQIQNPLLIGLH